MIDAVIDDQTRKLEDYRAIGDLAKDIAIMEKVRHIHLLVSAAEPRISFKLLCAAEAE